MYSRTGSTLLALTTLTLPMLASAVTVTDTLVLASSILNALIGLSITAAIVGIFYGVLRYMFFEKGNAEKQKEAITIALYGVGALFIMVSIWGIIRLLQSTLKVTSTDPIIPHGVVITPVSY